MTDRLTAITENMRIIRQLVGRLQALLNQIANPDEATDDQIAAVAALAEMLGFQMQHRGRLTAAAPPAARTRPQLANWNREQVRAQIEEATGEALSVDDSQPDTYIATAQELGMQPCDLMLWIYESPKVWNAASLTAWANRYGFTRGAAPGAAA
jgi:hypothetical protein